MALGAKAGDITRMVLGHALKLAAVGAAFGLAAAVALTQLLASQLYGVAALDAPTFITVAIFLTSVVLAASYLPARKAMRLDPNEALRSE